MKLSEFTSADPRMRAGGWRQELMAGEPRTLPPRDPASAFRIMQITSALLTCVRRIKADARIETAGGIGVEAEEGDEFRVADVVVALPEGRGHRPVIVCRIVADPESLDEDERERVALYRRCPSVREILILAEDRPLCRVHRRIGADWDEETRSGLEQAVRLARLEGSMFLATAYSDLLPPEPG